jgi:putative transposase
VGEWARSAPGKLVLGGRRVHVRKPRVRDEVALPMWAEFADDPLEERALEQVVLGVSTRKYRRSLEDVAADVTTRGDSRSAVSRRFKAATEQQVEALMARDLAGLDLVMIMMDGIHIDEHVILILIALGITAQGQKHVLGLWEGASENKAMCMTMLNSRVQRNLDAQQSCLFVIDGSKALRSVISDVFGARALVQRCQVHKRRNVLGHLPKELHPSIGKGIREAYAAPSKAAAKKRLLVLAAQLDSEHPSAAASIKDGLDETLTLKDMSPPKLLERTLSTTNAIENLNGGVRAITRRVKR